VTDADVAWAESAHDDLVRSRDAFFARWDLLAAPTAMMAPFAIETRWGSLGVLVVGWSFGWLVGSACTPYDRRSRFDGALINPLSSKMPTPSHTERSGGQLSLVASGSPATSTGCYWRARSRCWAAPQSASPAG